MNKDNNENCPAIILQKVFPDHKWQVWKFEITPKGYWNDENNQKQFMEWLGKEMGINEKGDWYRIQVSDFSQRGAEKLITLYNNSPAKLLSTVPGKMRFEQMLTFIQVYPEHNWQASEFKYV